MPLRHAELRQPGPELRRRRVPHRDRHLRLGHDLPGALPGRQKCVVIWGSNPAESSPPSWERLKDCQAQGAKLIVIDPRVTKTAARADLHLAVRPRTDGALALGLIHVMIEEELYDQEFVEKWCLGFDEVQRARRPKWTPERTSESPACPAASSIVEAARMYAQNTPGPHRLRRRADPARRGRLPLGAARPRDPARDLRQPRRPGRRAARQPVRREQFAWLQTRRLRAADRPPAAHARERQRGRDAGLLDHRLQAPSARRWRSVYPRVTPGLRLHPLREPAGHLPRHARPGPVPRQRDHRPGRRAAPDCMGGAPRRYRGLPEPEPRAPRRDGLLEDADRAARRLRAAGRRLPGAPRHQLPLGDRQLLRRRAEGRRAAASSGTTTTSSGPASAGGCSTRPTGRRRSRRCSTGSSSRPGGRTTSGRTAQTTTSSRSRAGASTRSRASRPASGKVELVPSSSPKLGVDPSPRYTGPPYARADAPRPSSRCR